MIDKIPFLENRFQKLIERGKNRLNAEFADLLLRRFEFVGVDVRVSDTAMDELVKARHHRALLAQRDHCLLERKSGPAHLMSTVLEKCGFFKTL